MTIPMFRWGLPFGERSRERELLDGDLLEPDELATNLRELAMLNRLPAGGAAASVAAVARLAGGRRDLHVLDAGTGGGDIALALARGGRSGAAGRWKVTALDRSAQVLAHAARRIGRARGSDVELLEGDVRSLPLADDSVDVSHTSLLVHHLDPGDAVAALRELRRVARLGVVVNDLRRGPVASAITELTVLALCRGRYTRHDGVASARRAYTLPELDALLAAAGLRVMHRSSAASPRVVTSAIPE